MPNITNPTDASPTQIAALSNVKRRGKWFCLTRVKTNFRSSRAPTQQIFGVLLSGGFIYLGGLESALATDNSTVTGLARFSITGNGRADPFFKPFAVATDLTALAEDANFIYVGGWTTLVRVSKSSGLIDPGWRPILNPTGVNSLSVASERSVFVTGNLNAGCGGAIVKAVRVHPGGNIDPVWRITLDGAARASLPVPPEDLLIGGNFSSANNNPHDGLIRVGPSEGLFADGAGDPCCVAPAS